MGFKTAFIFFLAASAAFPQEPQISTGAFDSSSLNFVIDKGNNASSLRVNYSLRWDFRDLKKAYLIPFLFYRDAVNLDLRKDVKLKYYGYKISPFKFFIGGKRTDVSGGNAQGQGANNAGPETKKKLRFSLSPLYDDLAENLDNFILDNSLKSVAPEWGQVSRENKKVFMKDFLKLGIWDYPGLREASGKLEKISD